jgi:pyruvate formate lyase activating enzyme
MQQQIMNALNNPQVVAMKQVLEQMTVEGELYDRLDDGRLHCYACGHECKIPPGRPGVCRVRFNDDGVLKVPGGYVNALACDPIEKKPFFHAFPGRDALSIGMLGCDLHCSYCQNWITSQTLRDPRAVADIHQVTAENVADLALRYNAPVIASTYNEPLITSEWAVSVMKPAKEAGIVGAYVSNGNATRRVLEYLRPYVQLYKIDLKSFDDRHYRQLGGQLANVLRTIRQAHEMGFWVEIVTLLVPGFNDSESELKQMADFIADVSVDMPWHVTAFHSDYKMDGTPNTNVHSLLRAAQIGREAGLHFVYAGNLPGHVDSWEDTVCPNCGHHVIERYGFMVKSNHLVNGHCPKCDTAIPGFWHADCIISQAGMGKSA